MNPVNLFYEEPDPDRWFPFDRYPRKLIRRLIRGRPFVGGNRLSFQKLCKGLARVKVNFRINNYRYISRHSEDIACIFGKPFVLNKINWKNPILFGTSIFSHPCDDPDLLKRLPIKKVLVGGEWMRKMFEPYYGEKVMAWHSGIDTEKWKSTCNGNRDVDILIYDKIMWERERQEGAFIKPIFNYLNSRKLKTVYLRYGHYTQKEFYLLLNRSKAMLFLCEHETKGNAYQEALSCNVPIFAWNEGRFWKDPRYFPHKVKFSPVSSVPYWDRRCGLQFKDLEGFRNKFEVFFDNVRSKRFQPRSYILENFTLEKCVRRYLQILEKLQ